MYTVLLYLILSTTVDQTASTVLVQLGTIRARTRPLTDGITKIGDVVLHNCSGSKYQDPLTNLREFFRLMCVKEAAHGIPPPIAPELMERRSSKPGDDSLATILLKQQHAAAEALTHAFYW